jgi:flagellar basal body-associated protein FliL
MSAEEAAAAQPEAKPKKKLPMTLILVLSVALVEAGGFVLAMKFFGGGPQVAVGAEGGDSAIEAPDDAGPARMAEVELLARFRAPNQKSGRSTIFDMDVFIKVPAARRDEIKQFGEDHKGEIQDHVARIVRSADPKVMLEPDLKTLRMLLRATLAEVFEDPELEIEVLVPRCVPIGGG